MTVYIELVLLDNFVFNFLLLYATDKVLKLSAKRLRLWLSAAAGAALAAVLPLIVLPQVIAVAAKLAVSVVMMLVFYRFRHIKRFLAVWFTFLAATFLAGGVLVGFFFLFQKDFALTDDLSIISGVPLGVYAAGGIAAAVLIKTLAAYMYRKKARHSNETDVTVVLAGKTFSLKGYLDSGNLLTDNVSGLPVLVVLSSALKDAVLQAGTQSLLGESCACAPHYLKYNTVSGEGKMFVVTPESISAGKKNISAVLGVPQHWGGASEYDLLLNGNLCLET